MIEKLLDLIEFLFDRKQRHYLWAVNKIQPESSVKSNFFAALACERCVSQLKITETDRMGGANALLLHILHHMWKRKEKENKQANKQDIPIPYA